jgi:hypothetical protein
MNLLSVVLTYGKQLRNPLDILIMFEKNLFLSSLYLAFEVSSRFIAKNDSKAQFSSLCPVNSQCKQTGRGAPEFIQFFGGFLHNCTKQICAFE